MTEGHFITALKKAYAYANLAVIVFKTNPITYIGSGTPKIKTSSLSDFDLSGDIRNLPQSEINKLQPIIQKYAEQAVTKALEKSGLISAAHLSIIPHHLRKSDQTFALKLLRFGSARWRGPLKNNNQYAIYDEKNFKSLV